MEIAIPTPLRPRPIGEFQKHGVDPVFSLVIHDGPATLRYLRVANDTATVGFVQIHDADELPEAASKPLLSIPLPANGEVVLDVPVYCSTGLVVAVSTTLASLTLSDKAALVFAKFIKQ